MLLWALLSWKPPFLNINPMRIMCAVSMYNKRPPTKAIAQVWPESVIDLMKGMWALDPASRPPISEARALLESLIQE